MSVNSNAPVSNEMKPYALLPPHVAIANNMEITVELNCDERTLAFYMSIRNDEQPYVYFRDIPVEDFPMCVALLPIKRDSAFKLLDSPHPCTSEEAPDFMSVDINVAQKSSNTSSVTSRKGSTRDNYRSSDDNNNLLNNNAEERRRRDEIVRLISRLTLLQTHLDVEMMKQSEGDDLEYALLLEEMSEKIGSTVKMLSDSNQAEIKDYEREVEKRKKDCHDLLNKKKQAKAESNVLELRALQGQLEASCKEAVELMAVTAANSFFSSFVIPPDMLLSNCRHFARWTKQTTDIVGEKVEEACRECGDKSASRVCLDCKVVLCGIYMNKHMTQHFEFHDKKENTLGMHSLLAIFQDPSRLWCCHCGKYIDDPIAVLKAKLILSDSSSSSSFRAELSRLNGFQGKFRDEIELSNRIVTFQHPDGRSICSMIRNSSMSLDLFPWCRMLPRILRFMEEHEWVPSDNSSSNLPSYKRQLESNSPNEPQPWRGCHFHSGFVDLSNATLDGMDLSRVSFRSCVLKGTSFKNSNLSDADFTAAEMIDVDFTASNISRANFSYAQIVNPRGYSSYWTPVGSAQSCHQLSGPNQSILTNILPLRHTRHVEYYKSGFGTTSAVRLWKVKILCHMRGFIRFGVLPTRAPTEFRYPAENGYFVTFGPGGYQLHSTGRARAIEWDYLTTSFKPQKSSDGMYHPLAPTPNANDVVIVRLDGYYRTLSFGISSVNNGALVLCYSEIPIQDFPLSFAVLTDTSGDSLQIIEDTVL